MPDLQMSYYPWITQHIDPKELDRSVNAFAAVVGAKLGRRVVVQPPMTVPAQVEAIKSGASQIALMNPFGYALAHRAVAKAESVAVALREPIKGTTTSTKPVATYRAQIYTRNDTKISTLQQLRHRSFAFGSSQSTSNFLVPARHLQKARVPAICSFKTLQFLGGHDLVAQAVYAGTVDAGAGHDGVISDLAKQKGYEDAETKLVRLEWTDEIKSDPVAVNLPALERDAVQRALLAAAEDPAGQAELKIFWGEVQGLAPAQAGDYDFLIEDMRELGLKYDEEMLG